MNSIQERIKYICESMYKGNINSAALAFGMAPNTLRGLAGLLQRGGELQDPKYEQIMKIFNATGVSLDWLMLGTGSEREYQAEPDTKQSPLSNDSNDCVRLREQNDQLAKNVSSLIEQNRSLVETNARLTQRLIVGNSDTPTLPSMDLDGHSYNKKSGESL